MKDVDLKKAVGMSWSRSMLRRFKKEYFKKPRTESPKEYYVRIAAPIKTLTQKPS